MNAHKMAPTAQTFPSKDDEVVVDVRAMVESAFVQWKLCRVKARLVGDSAGGRQRRDEGYRLK